MASRFVPLDHPETWKTYPTFDALRLKYQIPDEFLEERLRGVTYSFGSSQVDRGCKGIRSTARRWTSPLMYPDSDLDSFDNERHKAHGFEHEVS